MKERERERERDEEDQAIESEAILIMEPVRERRDTMHFTLKWANDGLRYRARRRWRFSYSESARSPWGRGTQGLGSPISR